MQFYFMLMSSLLLVPSQKNRDGRNGPYTVCSRRGGPARREMEVRGCQRRRPDGDHPRDRRDASPPSLLRAHALRPLPTLPANRGLRRRLSSRRRRQPLAWDRRRPRRGSGSCRGASCSSRSYSSGACLHGARGLHLLPVAAAIIFNIIHNR